jgi:tetratricopeptide (TPR) repeat protein
MSRRLSLLLFGSLTLFLSVYLRADDPKPAADNPDLVAAEQLYRSGRFADAADKYQAALKVDPKLVPAQAGLVRSLLREQKVEDAFAAASAALTAQPNSAMLLAVMGDVQFREGQMTGAETSYRKALQVDPRQVRPYLGLARIYRSYSLYRHANDELQAAHKIAPDDPEVQRAWFGQLPTRERIAAIEAYLSAPHPDNREETQSLHQYLDFLKAMAERPVHPCRLTSKVDQTDTKLEAMLRDPRHVIGYGLVVKLNDRNQRLLLDTGASGIVIGRKAAEKAGLTRIAAMSFAGIGDKGLQGGYLALAEHIRVGELEFQDCVVHVSDRASITDEDGLIGANVFGSYLIDIDMSDQKLRLSPLPKRPDEPEAPATLKTEKTDDESQADSDEKSGEGGDQKTGQSDVKKTDVAPKRRRLPMDRYIAPEMTKWTPVFRFGHTLLIPTRVNDSPSMLFMIDTGSTTNTLSKQAASQVTKISADPNSHVKGLSGNVSNVYRAEKATLVFGHLAQKNLDMVTFDLSNLSGHLGTEISGILGFNMLHMVQIKIDYRDGLVDFTYDAKRFGTGN